MEQEKNGSSQRHAGHADPERWWLSAPSTGTPSSQRIQQISRDFLFKCRKASLYPRVVPAGRPRIAASQVGRNGNGPGKAKFYSLTARRDESVLSAEMVNWERMSEAVALILRTVE